MEHATIERRLVKLGDHHSREALSGHGDRMDHDPDPRRNVAYSVTWSQTFAADHAQVKSAQAPRLCPCSTFA